MTPTGQLRAAWQARWEEALALWSRYTRLSSPRWCETAKEAKAQGLSSSFAMIRLSDHAVVINLAEVAARGLDDFALEVMGHEIGHHILVPGDLGDQGRLLARMRRNLPLQEEEAPLIANLYADLLINDRLQRRHGLDMAGVYRQLDDGQGASSPLWQLYMRAYEILWALPRRTLAAGKIGDTLEGDAQLAARIVRVYADDWLKGGARFAALCLPYLKRGKNEGIRARFAPWRDAGIADEGEIPDGLVEMDEDEDDTRHPADDPLLGGGASGDETADDIDSVAGSEKRGGRKSNRRYRDPIDYRELMKSLGVPLSDHEIAMRYYRERAVPWLVRFPERHVAHAAEPLPEGLETWDAGDPLEAVDWVETLVRSPTVIPGLTTLERTYGDSPGSEPQRQPLDLYIGIDCSGSMPNPQMQMSYTVLGGAILALSALRAGARVMACLSGEPGRAVATEGFVRREREIMELLTGYLGSGYTFGLIRLDDMRAKLAAGPQPARPVHILILTDSDIFSGLDNGDGGRRGWQMAAEALTAARGGGTMVLNLADEEGWKPQIAALREQGWQVHRIWDWDQVPAFARDFAQRAYGGEKRK